MRYLDTKFLLTVFSKYQLEMAITPTSNLNDGQRNWLNGLVTTKYQVYIRSLKRLNDFASIKPQQLINQKVINDFSACICSTWYVQAS